MAAAVEQENAEILPLDRYIRAVTICNNLALLASQGSVAQFLQRIAVLSRLQRYWTKGFDTIQVSCAEADALPPDSDGDDDGGGLASLVPVSSAGDWEARSDSTVDLKPDISTVVTDVSESANAQLAPNQNDGAEDDGDEDYRPSAKKHTRRVKRFTCQQCGEKFKYRSQLTRHENRSHKQVSDDVATSGTVAAAGEEWLSSPVEKKIVYSSTVELHDTDIIMPDTSGQCQLKTENCSFDDEYGYTASSGKFTDACLSSNTVTRRQQYIYPREKQRRSVGRKTPKCIARDQELVLLTDADTHRLSTAAGKASSSDSEVNSMQLTGSLKQEGDHSLMTRDSMDVSQPAHGLSIPENSSGCDGIFRCLKCGRGFTKLNHYVKHGKGYCAVRCTICKRTFEDVSTLKRHRVTCCRVLSAAAADRKSSKTEERKKRAAAQYACDQCGRVFKQRTTLNSHVLTHSGERPLECRVAGCDKRFTQHSTRLFHERTHSDEMAHMCHVCGRRFKHPVGVYLHMSVHTGRRPHCCSSCPMTFRRSCDLRRHSLVHSEERPFSCTHCQKCFRAKKTLDRHVLSLHSDEIPWRCSVCDKGFKSSGNLRVHLRVHSGDQPYACVVCDRRFSYNSSLKSHMQAHLAQ